MDYLTFLYFAIEIGIIVLSIVLSFQSIYWLFLLGTILIYPFPLETFLKMFFSIVEKFKKSKKINFDNKNCIVYHPVYNITFLGIEKRHSFDTCKYGKIYDVICKKFGQPNHQPSKINYSFYYSQQSLLHLILLNYFPYYLKISEIGLLVIPSILLRFFLLRRILYSTQGSLEGAEIALQKKFAINLSGGYHHAHSQGGSGFCFVNDIGMTIQYLKKYYSLEKFLIVDLDAHQGNGHERDKLITQNNVYIIDFYNPNIFPQDNYAKSAINTQEHFSYYSKDEDYLQKLQSHLKQSQFFKPEFLIYNAGTDCIKGDLLGGMSLSEQGIVLRDQMVFEFAQQNQVPILMLLSGGYTQMSAQVITKSLLNLNEKFSLFKQLNFQINLFNNEIIKSVRCYVNVGI